MTGPEKFNETELPGQDEFYSALTMSKLSDAEYERAKKTWEFFGCKTLRAYHDLYLRLDTVLLTDIFQNFRRTALACYDLDVCHYWSLPGYSWDACLKETGVMLDLITDKSQFCLLKVLYVVVCR